jgi:hypothetical protein
LKVRDSEKDPWGDTETWLHPVIEVNVLRTTTMLEMQKEWDNFMRIKKNRYSEKLGEVLFTWSVF